jgi:hypothetical protein
VFLLGRNFDTFDIAALVKVFAPASILTGFVTVRTRVIKQ